MKASAKSRQRLRAAQSEVAAKYDKPMAVITDLAVAVIPSSAYGRRSLYGYLRRVRSRKARCPPDSYFDKSERPGYQSVLYWSIRSTMRDWPLSYPLGGSKAYRTTVAGRTIMQHAPGGEFNAIRRFTIDGVEAEHKQTDPGIYALTAHAEGGIPTMLQAIQRSTARSTPVPTYCFLASITTKT